MGHRCPAIFFWHLEVSAEMESPYEKHLCQHVDAEHLPAFVPLPRVYFGFPPPMTQLPSCFSGTLSSGLNPQSLFCDSLRIKMFEPQMPRPQGLMVHASVPSSAAAYCLAPAKSPSVLRLAVFLCQLRELDRFLRSLLFSSNILLFIPMMTHELSCPVMFTQLFSLFPVSSHMLALCCPPQSLSPMAISFLFN